jgi:hypothetical protein
VRHRLVAGDFDPIARAQLGGGGALQRALRGRGGTDGAGRGLRQREPLHPAGERHLALHLEEGAKRSEGGGRAIGQLILRLGEEERLLVHRQQDVVVAPFDAVEHEGQVAEGVPARSRAAIDAPHEAGEAADAPRIRITDVERIAAPPEVG